MISVSLVKRLLFCGFFIYYIIRRFLILYLEYLSCISVQHVEQNHAKYSTGNDFADCYRDCKEYQASLKLVYIRQYQRHYDDVCHDWRYGCKPFVFSELIGSDCSGECRKRAEHNVHRRTACNKVAEQTAHEQSGNCSRCEKWEDCKCLRKPYLDCIVC